MNEILANALLEGWEIKGFNVERDQVHVLTVKGPNVRMFRFGVSWADGSEDHYGKVVTGQEVDLAWKDN